VEIGEHPVHGLKPVAGVDEEVAPALPGLKTPGLGGAVLQDPDAGGAHRGEALAPGSGRLEARGRGLG